MKEFKVNDIVFLYENLTAEMIDKITTMVRNNYELFIGSIGGIKIVSLVDTNDPNILYFPDIENFIEGLLIKNYFNKECFDYIFSNENVLNVYGSLLLRIIVDTYNDDPSILKLTINDIYKLLALRYYHDNKSLYEFIEYSKYMDKNETKKILDYFDEKYRYLLYEKLVKDELKRFPENNEQLLREFNSVIGFYYSIPEEIIKKALKKLKNPSNKTEPTFDRAYIDSDLRNKLFVEYLEYINAPRAWIDKFYQLLENNKIIESDSSCVLDDTVYIEKTNTLDDVAALAHEFTHVLNGNIDFRDSSLREFTSSYHELNIRDFLITKGYDERDASCSYVSKFYNEIKNLLCIMPIIKDMYILINGFSIDKQSLQQDYINSYRVREKSFLSDPNYTSLTDEELLILIDTSIDDRNIALLDFNTPLVLMFHYIISFILVIRVIDLQKDNNNICDIMNYITENSSYLNSFDDVLKLLKIDDFYGKKK